MTGPTNYEIDRGFSNTRPMDVSPQKLAEQLEKQEFHIAVNTIKNRLKRAGVSFQNGKAAPALYNYECLPIIIAYLKSYQTKQDLIRVSDFFDALEQELSNTSEYASSKRYLYDDIKFRNHLLNRHLHVPVNQRLECIKQLSEQLCILPTIHSQTPFDEANFDSILSYLDHIIIELSQAVTDNNDPDTAAVVNESAAESMSEQEQIRGFVRDSCKALKQMREHMYSEFGVISLSCSRDSSLDTVISEYKQLFDKKNPPPANSTATVVEETISRARAHLASSVAMSEKSERQFEHALRNVLHHNMSRYLRAVMAFRRTPDFEVPESLELKTVPRDLAANWYEHTKHITENLNRFVGGLCIIIATYKDSRKFSREFASNKTIQNFLSETEQVVQTFWDTMKEADYVPKQIDRAFLMTVLRHAPISKEVLGTRDNDDTVAGHLERVLHGKSLTSVHRVRQDFWAAAVTLEFFWRTHMEQSLPKMRESYKHYIADLQKYT